MNLKTQSSFFGTVALAIVYSATALAQGTNYFSSEGVSVRIGLEGTRGREPTFLTSDLFSHERVGNYLQSSSDQYQKVIDLALSKSGLTANTDAIILTWAYPRRILGAEVSSEQIRRFSVPLADGVALPQMADSYPIIRSDFGFSLNERGELDSVFFHLVTTKGKLQPRLAGVITICADELTIAEYGRERGTTVTVPKFWPADSNTRSQIADNVSGTGFMAKIREWISISPDQTPPFMDLFALESNSGAALEVTVIVTERTSNFAEKISLLKYVKTSGNMTCLSSLDNLNINKDRYSARADCSLGSQTYSASVTAEDYAGLKTTKDIECDGTTRHGARRCSISPP